MIPEEILDHPSDSCEDQFMETTNTTCPVHEIDNTCLVDPTPRPIHYIDLDDIEICTTNRVAMPGCFDCGSDHLARSWNHLAMSDAEWHNTNTGHDVYVIGTDGTIQVLTDAGWAD